MLGVPCHSRRSAERRGGRLPADVPRPGTGPAGVRAADAFVANFARVRLQRLRRAAYAAAIRSFRWAYRLASVRFATPSLRYVFERWNLTVCSVTHSSRAIRPFV